MNINVTFWVCFHFSKFSLFSVFEKEIGSVVKTRFTNIELVISKPRATILSSKLVVLCTYYYK